MIAYEEYITHSRLNLADTPIGHDQIEQASFQQHLCYLGSQTTRGKHDQRPVQIRHQEDQNDERVDHGTGGP